MFVHLTHTHTHVDTQIQQDRSEQITSFACPPPDCHVYRYVYTTLILFLVSSYCYTPHVLVRTCIGVKIKLRTCFN